MMWKLPVSVALETIQIKSLLKKRRLKLNRTVLAFYGYLDNN